MAEKKKSWLERSRAAYQEHKYGILEDAAGQAATAQLAKPKVEETPAGESSFDKLMREADEELKTKRKKEKETLAAKPKTSAKKRLGNKSF